MYQDANRSESKYFRKELILQKLPIIKQVTAILNHVEKENESKLLTEQPNELQKVSVYERILRRFPAQVLMLQDMSFIADIGEHQRRRSCWRKKPTIEHYHELRSQHEARTRRHACRTLLTPKFHLIVVKFQISLTRIIYCDASVESWHWIPMRVLCCGNLCYFSSLLFTGLFLSIFSLSPISFCSSSLLQHHNISSETWWKQHLYQSIRLLSECQNV